MASFFMQQDSFPFLSPYSHQELGVNPRDIWQEPVYEPFAESEVQSENLADMDDLDYSLDDDFSSSVETSDGASSSASSSVSHHSSASPTPSAAGSSKSSYLAYRRTAVCANPYTTTNPCRKGGKYPAKSPLPSRRQMADAIKRRNALLNYNPELLLVSVNDPSRVLCLACGKIEVPLSESMMWSQAQWTKHKKSRTHKTNRTKWVKGGCKGRMAWKLQLQSRV